jgi:hypothetical protein
MAEQAEVLVDVAQQESNEQASAPETVETSETPAEPVVEKTFTQAELDEMIQKRLSKVERKYEKRLTEAETRAKVLAEIKETVPAANKPVPENYTDYADYLEDLADYKAEEKFNALTQKQKDAEQNAKYQSEAERQNERKSEMISIGERKYDDFEEVVANSKYAISNAAYFAILETENAADVLYHLATNKADAERISALSPYAQAKEIGKLEDKLLAAPKKLTSDAPEPIKPVGGAKAITQGYRPDMTDAEYAAWRNRKSG